MRIQSVHEFLPRCSQTRSAWRQVLEHAICTFGLALAMALAIAAALSFRPGGVLLNSLVGGLFFLLVMAVELVAESMFGVSDPAALFDGIPEGVVLFATLPIFMLLWLTLPVALVVPLLSRIMPNPRAAEPRPWCGLLAHLLAVICSAAVAWVLAWSWFGENQLITGGALPSPAESRAQAIESAWYVVGVSALPNALLPLALMILRRAIPRLWRRARGRKS